MSNRKRNLLELQREFPGSKFSVIKRFDAADVIPALRLEDVSPLAAAQICARCPDLSSRTVSIGYRGDYQASIDGRLIRAVSPYAFDAGIDASMGDIQFALFAIGRNVCLISYEEDISGALIESVGFSKPPLVDFATFQQAISVACDAGAVKLINDSGVKEKEDPRLSDFHLFPQIGPGRGTLRLDIAMAAMKIEGDIDHYGEKILGVSLSRKIGEQKYYKWKIVYSMGEDGYIDDADVATVDHVKPRSLGGCLELDNLQLMRAGSNWRKSNREWILPKDDGKPVEELLDRLILGAEHAKISPLTMTKLLDAINFEKMALEPETEEDEEQEKPQAIIVRQTGLSKSVKKLLTRMR